jgi:hypothetical protein
MPESPTGNQTAEVIAKEITLAIIQKYSYTNDEKLIGKIKNIYNEVHKQVIESSRENYK